MNKLLPFVALLLLPGCASVGLQSKRIFQAEVPPPVIKKVEEDIKQASDYLARTVEQPQEAAEVAITLSQRVGPPQAKQDNPAAIQASLRKGNASHEKAQDKSNEWLEERQGTKLEGTGLSIWGAGGGIIIVAVIALCFLVPALIPLVIQIVQTIAGTSRAVLSQTVHNIKDAVEEFNKDNPEAAEELKVILSKRMDAKNKAVIQKAKTNQLK